MKPHWIETENHEELIDHLTDMMIALYEDGNVQETTLTFDNEGTEEKVGIRIFHKDCQYHVELYDEAPDKEQLLKALELEMNEETGGNSKIFFDRSDFFSVKMEDIMGSETVVAHLGGGNIHFDIPQSPEVTELIGEFYKLILEEENR